MMLRSLSLSLFGIAFLQATSLAQDKPKVQASLPTIVLNNSLSKTLLDVADKSKVNIVADTTNQDPDPEANRPTNDPTNLTVGEFISEQAPVYGYYWNQTSKDSVLIWPKPDIAALARKIAERWQQQSWKEETLPPEIKAYFSDVAHQVDRDGGEEKRDKRVTYSIFSSQLPKEKLEVLSPLLLKAQRQSCVDRNLSWLRDDFWSHAQVSIYRFNDRDTWYLSGVTGADMSVGRGLMPAIPGVSFVPYKQKFEADEAVAQQMGTRWEGAKPDALTKAVQLKVENASPLAVMEQLSQICGVTIQLDETVAAQLKDKRLTIDTCDMTPSTMLHDIALLFDLKWTCDGDKAVAIFNKVEDENIAAKVGSLPCLASWNARTTSTHPDWDALFAQETTAARAKKGLPLSDFSEELQASLRDYCQEKEASEILRTWLTTNGVTPILGKLAWELMPSLLLKNDVPLPEQRLTREEINDPEIFAAYNKRYYVLSRLYTVTISSGASNSRYANLSFSLEQEPQEK